MQGVKHFKQSKAQYSTRVVVTFTYKTFGTLIRVSCDNLKTLIDAALIDTLARVYN